MIRLTSIDGASIFINPNKVASVIEGSATHSEVYIAPDQFYCVTESPQEVARKVLEWRLAMIDYHHDITSVKTKAMAELVRLAGLEEPEHD
jgi:uncharacterized protein YlzI (FlbEa/FlbD family)